MSARLPIRIAVAVAAAALLSTLVAPWGLYYLHWGAYLPIFWALREDTPRHNLILAFLYGTVAEGLIFSWIAETITLFSNIPAVGAWAINGLFAAVFGLPYLAMLAAVHPLRQRMGDLWIVVLPAWLVLVEFVAMNVLLFPYNQGVSQYVFPPVWQLASVTGVWGLSFLVLFFNAAFAEVIYRRREGRPLPIRWMSAAVIVLGGVMTWGSWRFARVEAQLAEAPVKRVFQLQSSWSMLDRMRMPRTEAFSFWVDRTRDLPPGSTDLVVWPEGSVPFQLNTSSAAITLWDLTEVLDFDLVVGAGTRERPPIEEMGETERVRIFNSVYAFSRAARDLPDPAPSLASDWDFLVDAGCDLDHAHVFTLYEVAELVRWGEAQGEDAACLQALRERGQALATAERALPPELAERLAAESALWPRVRAQTGRFTAPLRDEGATRRRGAWYWWLEESTCVDDDCRKLTVRCPPDDPCDVYPEAPHYDKMVPLPFGEYLPFAETFPWLGDLIQGPGNFRAGTEPVLFGTSGMSIATPICYEAILGYVCDDFDQPDVFVNVTNDAWFGPTAASALHGMLAANRAIELGVPVFRSAFSGLSFVVEPHGVIYAETDLFEEEARVVPIRLATVDTFYRRYGDWFVWVCALGFGLSMWGTRREAGA